MYHCTEWAQNGNNEEISHGVQRCPMLSHGVPRCPTMSNGVQRWPTMDTDGLQRVAVQSRSSKILFAFFGDLHWTNGVLRFPAASHGVQRRPTVSNVVPRCPMSSHVAVQFRLSKILFVAFRNPKWTVLAWFWAWYRIIVQCLYLSM